MANSSEIRQYLEQWLDSKISLRQFQEWFVPVAGTVHGEHNPEAERLVDDIDMALSEYSDGVLTGQQLRGELTKIGRPFAQIAISAVPSYKPDPLLFGIPVGAIAVSSFSSASMIDFRIAALEAKIVPVASKPSKKTALAIVRVERAARELSVA